VRPQHALAFAFLAAALAFSPTNALADPQVSSALTIGGGAVGLQSGGRPVGVFHLGARADVLFLRSRDREMGIGPYIEVASEAFHSFEAGGGVDWLIPLSPAFPFVLSAGAAARNTPETGWEPGVATSLFWGSRGYNFHSWYGLSLGLFVEARYSLGPSHDTGIVGGLQTDLSFLAYPFLFIYGALK
jgi:hypothetical protein